MDTGRIHKEESSPGGVEDDPACAGSSEGEHPSQAPTLAGPPSAPPRSIPRVSVAPGTSRWDRYEMLELLGKGGMGAVYKARDRKLGRVVALKFILRDDPALAQRFMQEARAQARIEHDHVCKVYEVGEVQGNAFIAMQFIDGQPLPVAQHQMSQEEKVAVLTLVAEAVHAAHRQGVIHRDIKPGNIMVERAEDGKWRPIIMDFGLAHDTRAAQALTQAGELLGTPQYMPPEQARGDIASIDRRSDVYGLGAVLYELLTGEPPFDGQTLAEILIQVLDKEPQPPRSRVPSLPVDLETITLKCLQKEPTQRYESARALADDLRRYLDGEPIRARRTSFGYKAVRWARKRPAVVGLAAALMFGFSLSGGIVVRTQRRAQAETRAQARLAEQLGRDVKEMELFTRVGLMMPRHDVSPQKDAVRERMRQIEQRALQVPLERRAAAQYALGRGHLALREYGAAIERLQAAWDQGYHVAEVSYALGRALGEQYKLQLEEVERIGDAGYRQRERQRLEGRYLAPAREQLSQASAATLESPDYVRGLFALYSQHNEEAIQRAAAALKDRPWQYEAHVLAGDAWTRLGITAQEQGRHLEARQDFDRAIASYAQASDLARSDASIYQSEASTWANVIENEMRQGGDPRAAYESGLRACDHAIEADPRDIKAYERKIRIYERWGNYLFFRGQGLSDVASLAVQTLEQAMALGGVSATTYDAMGGLEFYSSGYVIAHGMDPRSSLQQARIYFQRAISVSPKFAWAWNDWGALEALNYEWLARHGGTLDELQLHLTESGSKLRRAVELDPSYANGHSSLVDLAAKRAKVALAAGLPLTEPLRDAAESDRLGNQLNAHDFLLPNNFALVRLAAARHLYLGNQDPGPELARVYENADKALRLKADYPEHHQTRAEAYLIAASYALARGDDVADEVARGLEALAERARHSPNDARDEILRARLLIVRARWLERQRREAGATWEQAAAAAAAAQKIDAADPEASLATAELARCRVESGAIEGRAAAQLVEQGLAAAEQALRQQPWNTFAQATQAALWLLRGRTTQDASAKAVWMDKGRRELARALKQNRLLEKEYGGLLDATE